jgi:glycerophosphoryl diester phosphodiesterase
MAYVGPQDNPENKPLYDLLHEKGIMCMVAAAPVYDKLPTAEERKSAYQRIIQNGVDIIESDLPIEVSRALKGL